jgi:hypothetical protein
VKTAFITIRIEEDLRARFSEVAEQLHRPAAQVVRDLMRNFVRDNSPANTASTVPDDSSRAALSPEKLRYFHEQSLASARLEGFVPSPEFLADCEAVLAGSMTRDEARAASLARAKALEKANLARAQVGQAA